MQTSILLFFAAWLMSASMLAQTDRADYAAIQEPIAGVAVTWGGTVYSFAGGRGALGDGNLFPDTLSLDGVNSLVPQEGSLFGNQTTLDTWWSPGNNMYYNFELVHFNCDAGYESAQIISFPKDDPANIDTVEVVNIQSWSGEVNLVVAGNRFAVKEGRNLVTAKFNDPLDTTVINLENFDRDGFPSKVTTIRDKIYVADGSKLMIIDSNAVVTEVQLNQEILGLGIHGFSFPGIIAITPTGAVKLQDDVVIDNTPFDESYTFESLVMTPFSRTFLCTFQENGGDLKYGLGSGASSITSFTNVDPGNPGRYTEFIQTNTSAGGNARSVAVLEFENSLSSILLSTQNAVEFVDIEHADVEIVGVEMESEPADPPPSQYFFAKPIIRNNSSSTIESIQVAGEIFAGPCRIRNMKTYTALGLLPGEERQLERFEIYSPALEIVGGNLTGQVNLSSANNFPIKQGNSRSATGVVTISSTREAVAKTTTAFPNPAFTTVQIELPAGAIVQSASASDMLGRTITSLSFHENELDVAQLAPGTYTIELQLLDGQRFHAKMLKL